MDKNALFDWLVRYHIEKNLPESMDYTSEGRLLNRKGLPVNEGKDNDVPYHGILLVSNGDTLMRKLEEDKVLLTREHDSFAPLRSFSDLSDYLDKQDGEDGAYLHDGKNKRITRVYELNNNPNLPDDFDRLALIPEDFVYSDGRAAEMRNIGTKTSLAIKLPQAHPEVETYQIKRSAYGSLGMGKVTRFTKEGLAEEFFFAYAPESQGPFIDENNKIIGIYRRYERFEGRPQCVEETLVNPQECYQKDSVNDSLRITAQQRYPALTEHASEGLTAELLC